MQVHLEDCFDGQDNDCDGLADTEDDDCLELECTDGLDDDGDGLVDVMILIVVLIQCVQKRFVTINKMKTWMV